MIAQQTRPAPPASSPSPQKSAGRPPGGRRQVSFGPIEPQGHRVVLYGPGGVGKSSLASVAPGPVAFVDLDESMPVLRSQLPAQADIRLVSGVSSWQDLRETLAADGWDEIRTLVIDSVTKAEELAGEWVLDNVRRENGQKAQRLEDYGWGRQFGHIYDTFLALLGDLDRHIRSGRHVVLIAHDCTTEVPNPSGPNWLRYEPRLQSPSSGKNSIRLRVREWADHVLYLGYDKGNVTEGKMAKGFETRTIYPVETPHCMAKSRTCSDAMAAELHDANLWSGILNQPSQG